MKKRKNELFSSFDHVPCLSIIHVLCSLKFKGNQKVKSIIVTEVTVRSPFITYSRQNPWNFLEMEVIMIKEDDKCLSLFSIKIDTGYVSSIRTRNSTQENVIYKCYK